MKYRARIVTHSFMLYFYHSSLLAISIIVDLATAQLSLSNVGILQPSHIPPLDNEPNDPCKCACGPIVDSLPSCSSNNTFCGCDALIGSSGPCAACIATQPSTLVDPTRVQIRRALCVCQSACETVANATISCLLGPQSTACVCPTLIKDGETCNACIKENDAFAGQMFDSFITLCKNGAHFRNDSNLIRVSLILQIRVSIFEDAKGRESEYFELIKDRKLHLDLLST